MTRQNRHLLTQWLTAEAADAEVRAEAALTALLEWLPEEAPSTAFTENVLARVRHDTRQARRLTWLLRAAAVLGLAVVGGSLIAIPTVLLALPASIGSVISALASGLSGLAKWLSYAVSLWEGIAGVGRKIGLVLATPEVTLVMLGVAGVGATAFRVLYGLTMQDRRALHVDSL